VLPPSTGFATLPATRHSIHWKHVSKTRPTLASSPIALEEITQISPIVSQTRILSSSPLCQPAAPSARQGTRAHEPVATSTTAHPLLVLLKGTLSFSLATASQPPPPPYVTINTEKKFILFQLSLGLHTLTRSPRRKSLRGCFCQPRHLAVAPAMTAGVQTSILHSLNLEAQSRTETAAKQRARATNWEVGGCALQPFQSCGPS
jgi:hypothetical protein